MKLTQIATMQGVEFLDEEDEFDYMTDAYDKLSVLKEKTDLIKLTMKDKTTHYLAKVNFSMGRCDCCNDINKSKISLYEFFTIKE